MKRCVILCAGECAAICHEVQSADLVIAADGGVRHASQLGLEPQIILGDFDSLGYTPAGAEVFPAEKDDTDSMLAIKKGLSLGCDTFLLYGAMDGNRPDHTVANYQALLYLASRGARGYLIGKQQIATVIHNDRIHFPAHFTGYVSLFCLGSDCRGVTAQGLQYPLTDGTLTADFPLGVSNRFLGVPARVEVQQGSLLLLWQTGNGLA